MPSAEDLQDYFQANGECRSCGKSVIFVTMLPSEKTTPIDPDLEHGGNVEIRKNSKGKLYAKVTGPDPEQRKWISHFATCPQADGWRNRKVDTTPRGYVQPSEPQVTRRETQPPPVAKKETWAEERARMLKGILEKL